MKEPRTATGPSCATTKPLAATLALSNPNAPEPNTTATCASASALRRFREQARTNLLSEHGKAMRIQRNVEVESVFGQIKHNMHFRRFSLRGLEKVKTEWGLICIAHNMQKLAAR